MEAKKNIFSKLFYSCIGLMLLLINQVAFAVVITPNTIINVPTTYSNTTVDLSNGNFIVKDGASLTIENSTIIGTISPTNTNLISVERGTLNLIHNEVTITASMINPTPKIDASFYVVRLSRAAANIVGNTFSVDKQFSVGFLTTSVIQPAKNITISNNEFQGFHGVIYLLNSNNTVVDSNSFKLNSSGQIVIVGSNSHITSNSIYFSGLTQLGDAIDLVNAEGVVVAKNLIFTPTSVGISITLSHDVTVDGNTVMGGITYGIAMFSNSALKDPNNFAAKILAKLDKRTKILQATSDITIRNNFLGQNRYGIAATDVDGLTVVNNYFTQRFNDAAARKFWTDNSVLLQNVTSLTWTNNVYTEAFTQVNGGDNSMVKFVPFPATGGVVL